MSSRMSTKRSMEWRRNRNMPTRPVPGGAQQRPVEPRKRGPLAPLKPMDFHTRLMYYVEQGGSSRLVVLSNPEELMGGITPKQRKRLIKKENHRQAPPRPPRPRRRRREWE